MRSVDLGLCVSLIYFEDFPKRDTTVTRFLGWPGTDHLSWPNERTISLYLMQKPRSLPRISWLVLVLLQCRLRSIEMTNNEVYRFLRPAITCVKSCFHDNCNSFVQILTEVSTPTVWCTFLETAFAEIEQATHHPFRLKHHPFLDLVDREFNKYARFSSQSDSPGYWVSNFGILFHPYQPLDRDKSREQVESIFRRNRLVALALRRILLDEPTDDPQFEPIGSNPRWSKKMNIKEVSSVMVYRDEPCKPWAL